jgi:hypothetical protein
MKCPVCLKEVELIYVAEERVNKIAVEGGEFQLFENINVEPREMMIFHTGENDDPCIITEDEYEHFIELLQFLLRRVPQPALEIAHLFSEEELKGGEQA